MPGIKGVCPVCMSVGPLEGFITDVHAREAIRQAMHLPPQLADLVIRYLGLFAPRQKVLSHARLTKLLIELIPPVKEGYVERHGRKWPAPMQYWLTALEQMIAKTDLQLPLKTHGYLFAIVSGIADSGEAKKENKREQQRRFRDPKLTNSAGPGRGSRVVTNPITGFPTASELEEKIDNNNTPPEADHDQRTGLRRTEK